MYAFINPNGIVFFRPGTHLRLWRQMRVPAHDILVGYNSRCFHAPGPGRCFSEDDLNAVLANADAVQVVSDANSLAEVSERIARARQILGLPWDFVFSNCQDTLSWITTGRSGSFQREGIVTLALLVGVGTLMLNSVTGSSRR